MSATPPPEFRSGQYEFTADQNRTINALAGAMEVVATLMKLVGVAFLAFFGLTLLQAAQAGGGYGAAVGLGAAMLICLAVGLWTGGAARSFRRIVETQNRDVWHLMNALESLHKMYSLVRTIALAGLALLVIGLALLAFDRLRG